MQLLLNPSTKKSFHEFSINKSKHMKRNIKEQRKDSNSISLNLATNYALARTLA